MKYSKNNAQNNNGRRVLVFVTILLLIGLGVYAYASSRNNDTSEQDDSSINYGPPTEEEQRAGDERKDQIIEERENSEEATNNDESTKREAEVIIVDANQYDDIIEVRAFVSDHIEDGTCSYRFTRNSNTVEKSLPAHADASTTVCPALEVNRSEFPSSGDWQLIVSYESANAKGSSEAQTVTIN